MRITLISSSPRRRGSRIAGPRLKAGVTLLFIFFASCATFPGKTPQKGTVKTPLPTSTTTQTPSVPRETKVPESTNYAAVTTPKRQVSTQLVAQGKEFLDKKDYDHARQRLEEAVSVDPTNGAAYYHLAVVYYDLRDIPKALGFLDQAETLLHGSTEWAQTIQQFREILQHASAPHLSFRGTIRMLSHKPMRIDHIRPRGKHDTAIG